MTLYEFVAHLERPEGVGTWTYLDVPFNVEDAFCKKGQVKVKGTINDFPYRSSVMPHGDGTHYMVVNQTIREAIGLNRGDKVNVTMEIDLEPRTVEVPEDFQKLLDEDPTAKTKFEGFTYSHKKEWVDWINAAKREETRVKRIQKAILELIGERTG